MYIFNSPDIIRESAFKKFEEYGTRNALDIGDSMGINIYLRDDFRGLKGMYSSYLGERSIHVNSNGTTAEQIMYGGHELGHDIFHQKLAATFSYFDTDFFVRDRTEYEANLFDAHLLLDEEQILDLAASGYELDQIAVMMNTYRELLLIKLRDMSERGLPVRAAYSPLMNFWSMK